MMYCVGRRATTAYHPVHGIVAERAAASLMHGASGGLARRATRGSLGGHLAEPRADHRLAEAQRASDDALVETVVLLEAAAIALGAADLTPERLGVARDADRALRACRHDPFAAAGLARLFHRTLLGACPNTHMLDLIRREISDTSPSRPVFDVGADELGRVADAHEAILDMIAAGAPAGELERTLRRHSSTSALCAIGLPDRGGA